MTEHVHTGRVCALILAGGRSERMGSDKPQLTLAGQTLLERAAEFWRASGAVGDILAAVGERGHLDALPEGVMPVYDLFPGQGPMAGLHAAFSCTDAEVVYVSAVDMPFLMRGALLPVPDGDAAVYVRGGRPEPLFGVYRRSALPALDAALRGGRRRMSELIGELRTEYVELPVSMERAVANVNTREDFWRAAAGSPPMTAVVGWSGSGKTTFLEKLLPILASHGLRVAVVKHDAHRFEMDKPGKDTYRLAAAGAVCTAISGPNGWAVLGKDEIEIEAFRAKLPPVDLILVEGHKYSLLPKIEVHRRAVGKPFITYDMTLLAAVTDEHIGGISAPQLGLEDAAACAELIIRTFLEE